jgi:hypothetical protein
MLKIETLILVRQGFHLRQGYDVTRRRDKEGEIDAATPRSYQLSVNSCLGRVSRFDIAARLPLC